MGAGPLPAGSLSRGLYHSPRFVSMTVKEAQVDPPRCHILSTCARGRATHVQVCAGCSVGTMSALCPDVQPALLCRAYSSGACEHATTAILAASRWLCCLATAVRGLTVIRQPTQPRRLAAVKKTGTTCQPLPPPRHVRALCNPGPLTQALICLVQAQTGAARAPCCGWSWGGSSPSLDKSRWAPMLWCPTTLSRIRCFASTPPPPAQCSAGSLGSCGGSVRLPAACSGSPLIAKRAGIPT